MEKLLEMTERALIIFVIFSLGILVGTAITGNFFGFEIPSGIFQYNEQSIPRDRISEDNITIYPDKIIISIEITTLYFFPHCHNRSQYVKHRILIANHCYEF